MNYSAEDPNSENPYATTAPLAHGPVAPGYNNAHGYTGQANANMVWQVRLLGIFQIILAALEFILCFAASAFVLLALSEFNDGFRGDPDAFLATAISSCFALGLFVIATLRLISGIWCFYLKGRLLTIISLVLGLATSLTCYCAFFAIGIAVYGLVIMLHPAVVQAYEMRRQGSDVRQVMAAFGLR